MELANHNSPLVCLHGLSAPTLLARYHCLTSYVSYNSPVHGRQVRKQVIYVTAQTIDNKAVRQRVREKRNENIKGPRQVDTNAFSNTP